ncbi:MAG: MerR family transcriptional regulator [Alphaproteobacteria bacterium]
MSETPPAIIGMGMAEDFERSRPSKSASAFRTISEVADQLDVPQHVLRFWETRFAQIRPLKRAGGRRYYRPEDVDLLRRIRGLLYQQGYTIKGVQKLLRDTPRERAEAAAVVAATPEAVPAPIAQAAGARAEHVADAAPALAKGDAGQGGPSASDLDEARTALEDLVRELEAIRSELLLLKSSGR